MTAAASELDSLIDAQGHRVAMTVTRSGLLAIITSTPADGIMSGPPIVSREGAVTMRDALTRYIGDGPQAGGEAP